MADTLEVRMARLEGSYEQISERLGTIEGRLDSVERDIAGLRTEMYQGFESLGDKLRQEMRTQLYWVLGVIIVGLIVPLVVQLVS